MTLWWAWLRPTCHEPFMPSDSCETSCFFTKLETSLVTAEISYHLRKHWKFWLAYHSFMANYAERWVSNVLFTSVVKQPAVKSLSSDSILEILRSRHEITFSIFRDLPAQDRVFHILSSRISMARKCDKSPANLNTFILCVVEFKWRNQIEEYFLWNHKSVRLFDVEARGRKRQKALFS